MERSGRSPEGEQPSAWRKGGHTLSGRTAVRLAEERTDAQRKNSRPSGGRVPDSAGKAVGWPDADQGEDQGEDQGADQGEDQGADQGAGQGADQGADQRCGQKMRTGLHFWCARL